MQSHTSCVITVLLSYLYQGTLEDLYSAISDHADTESSANTTHNSTRNIVVAKNLTKPDEEIFRGSVLEALRWVANKAMVGEYALILSPFHFQHSNR